MLFVNNVCQVSPNCLYCCKNVSQLFVFLALIKVGVMKFILSFSGHFTSFFEENSQFAKFHFGINMIISNWY